MANKQTSNAPIHANEMARKNCAIRRIRSLQGKSKFYTNLTPANAAERLRELIGKINSTSDSDQIAYYKLPCCFVAMFISSSQYEGLYEEAMTAFDAMAIRNGGFSIHQYKPPEIIDYPAKDQSGETTELFVLPESLSLYDRFEAATTLAELK